MLDSKNSHKPSSVVGVEPKSESLTPKPCLDTPQRRKSGKGGKKPAISRSGVRTPVKWGKIDLGVVERVSERVARGVPLKYACVLENPPINDNQYGSMLSRHPNLQLVHNQGIGKFVDEATKLMYAGDDAGIKRLNGILAILERRHSSDWAKPAMATVQITNTTNMLVQGMNGEMQSQFEQRLKRIESMPALPVESEVKPCDKSE